MRASAAAGNFANTASLTLGPAATMSVAGTYTQGPSGSLTIGIGGTPASGQFGTLRISGAAALAGGIGSTAMNGYELVAGDSYKIATYASQTGGANLSFAGLDNGRFAFFQPEVESTSIVLETTTNAADLVPQPATAPASGTVGQTITLSDTIDNLSSNAASPSWVDSYYLSPEPTLAESAVLLGRVERTTGVAGNSSYTSTLHAAIPPVLHRATIM